MFFAEKLPPSLVLAASGKRTVFGLSIVDTDTFYGMDYRST